MILNRLRMMMIDLRLTPKGTVLVQLFRTYSTSVLFCNSHQYNWYPLAAFICAYPWCRAGGAVWMHEPRGTGTVTRIYPHAGIRGRGVLGAASSATRSASSPATVMLIKS